VIEDGGEGSSQRRQDESADSNADTETCEHSERPGPAQRIALRSERQEPGQREQARHQTECVVQYQVPAPRDDHPHSTVPRARMAAPRKPRMRRERVPHPKAPGRPRRGRRRARWPRRPMANAAKRQRMHRRSRASRCAGSTRGSMRRDASRRRARRKLVRAPPYRRARGPCRRGLPRLSTSAGLVKNVRASAPQPIIAPATSAENDEATANTAHVALTRTPKRHQPNSRKSKAAASLEATPAAVPPSRLRRDRAGLRREWSARPAMHGRRDTSPERNARKGRAPRPAFPSTSLHNR
jgi:hypothetical protein